MPSPRARRLALVLPPIALIGALSCAVAVSRTPLSNSDPVGTDVYFYGPHSPGGKKDGPEATPEPKHAKAPPKLPHAPSLTTAQVAKDDKATAKKLQVPEIELDGDAGAPLVLTDVAGRYAGTDTVTILLQGIPSDPQVDENAKIDLKNVGDQRVALTVVDSSQGTPLCTIEGKITGGEVAFDPGQDCFTEILGIPAQAQLTTGTAKVTRESLTVDFEVALEVVAPGTTIEGSIDYHFEGTKLSSP